MLHENYTVSAFNEHIIAFQFFALFPAFGWYAFILGLTPDVFSKYFDKKPPRNLPERLSEYY
jgi:hypothetical protein